MKKSNTLWWVIGIVIAVGLLSYGIWRVQSNQAPGALDEFAKCLADKGAEFWGAFWCPHCQTQKKMFGSSFKYVKYIECSTPDGSSQVPACTQKGIKGYPTWIFADGSRLEGEVALSKLAEKTSCTLPAQ